MNYNSYQKFNCNEKYPLQKNPDKTIYIPRLRISKSCGTYMSFLLRFHQAVSDLLNVFVIGLFFEIFYLVFVLFIFD